jgi:chemotaxis protein methyltransferase CheR
MFEPVQNRTRIDSAPKLTDETFIVLRDFIYSKTGIYFPVKKKYLLEGRLLKRLQILKLGCFEDYIHLLKHGRQKEEEFEFLCNIITINETFFFRNDAQIEAFKEKFAEEVIQAKAVSNNHKLRIWSAACSSGEEPYTLAILYLEHIKPKYPDLEIEIVATDINTAVLDMASKAEYNQYSIRSTPKLYLDKYFEQSNGVYRLKQEVKELVRFEYVNLIDREKMRRMVHFDFIFCANVMIYFDEKAKIQVVGDLFNSLNRGGYLLIGFSEMLHRISTAFKLVSIPRTTAYKKE